MRDRLGFAVVYEHYKPIFEKRLFHLIGDREAAYDLYQDAFLRVWRSPPRISSLSEFEKWLNTVMAY